MLKTKVPSAVLRQAQCNMIIKHFKKWRTISVRQAQEKYDIWRLGARIFELRRYRSCPIETVWKYTSQGKDYVEYYTNLKAFQKWMRGKKKRGSKSLKK